MEFSNGIANFECVFLHSDNSRDAILLDVIVKTNLPMNAIEANS